MRAARIACVVAGTVAELIRRYDETRRTLLIERYGFLGGMGTAAGVTNFCGLHANVRGEHRQVVHGVAEGDDRGPQRRRAEHVANSPRHAAERRGCREGTGAARQFFIFHERFRPGDCAGSRRTASPPAC